jgi:hypothetical protein
MTLHFTQIFFTDARTFIFAALLRASNPGRGSFLPVAQFNHYLTTVH